MASLNLDVSPTGHGKGAQTPKGRHRRDVILRTAARLFAEHGFGNVAINDIGFEAGVTGPAIYRYFPSKEALLISIYSDLYTTSTENIDRIVSEVPNGVKRIVALVDSQIDLATSQAEAIRIIESEWRHLPDKEATVLRKAAQHGFKAWADAVAAACPSLDAGTVEITTHGILAMINSISRRRAAHPLSPTQRLRLAEMAYSAIFGQPTPPKGNVAPARTRKR